GEVVDQLVHRESMAALNRLSRLRARPKRAFSRGVPVSRYRLPLASAAVTANLISTTENGLEITSLISASRPDARSRWSAKPVISRIGRAGKSRAVASARARP